MLPKPDPPEGPETTAVTVSEPAKPVDVNAVGELMLVLSLIGEELVKELNSVDWLLNEDVCGCEEVENCCVLVEDEDVLKLVLNVLDDELWNDEVIADVLVLGKKVLEVVLGETVEVVEVEAGVDETEELEGPGGPGWRRMWMRSGFRFGSPDSTKPNELKIVRMRAKRSLIVGDDLGMQTAWDKMPSGSLVT